MAEQRRMNWMGLALLAAVLVLVYVLFLAPRHSLAPDPRQASHPQKLTALEQGPSFGSCPVFPADNVWNTRVDRLPKSPLSQAFVDSIGPLHSLHPDFGTSSTSGIPVTTIPAGTPGVPVKFDYTEDSDNVSYPIPADAQVEGGPNGMGDRHIILVDPATCILYELFAAQSKGTAWNAGSGIVMDLTSNALRTDHKTSADAAGLPILPGLVRFDEAASGEIRHALRFTLPQTQAAYIWPARHFASKLTSTNYPAMGQRFRLRSSFDETKFSPEAQVIARALKRYGMILADNGGALYISGVPDSRWNDDELHKLSTIKAEDLEAVDESALRLLPDSARSNPAGIPR